MPNHTEDDKKQWDELASSPYTRQAVWWLNGFWDETGGETGAEKVWDAVHQMIEINTGRPKLYGQKTEAVEEAADLDEMQSHIFLEKQGNTLTVMALRKVLKELDIDNNKRMCMLEWLAATNKKSLQEVARAPQGEIDPAQLKHAQDALNFAQESFDKAVLEKKQADEAAVKALEAKVAAEAAAAELQAAVDELKAQEDAFAKKMADLETIANSPDSGVVKKNKAKNQIEQMKAEDPLPLNRAKLTQKAALKKSEKAAKKAAAEKENADKEAEQAAQAQVAAEAAFADAEQALKDLMKGGGVSQGKIWWMQRELAEKKKYMPRKR